MTSVESSKKSKELHCEICDSPFDTESHCPRILKECGHTICEQCAQKLWEQKKKTAVVCPFDRTVTEVKGDIKNLPKNFTLDRLLDAQNPTGRCSEDSSHEAWFTCKECEADFCESCFDSAHYKCDKTDKWYPEKLSNNEQSIQVPKCKKHPANFADYLCNNGNCEIENIPICNACLREDHKDCAHLDYKECAADNLKSLTEELSKKPALEETEPYLDCYIPKYRDSYASEENEEYSELLKKINSFYDKQKAEAIQKLKEFAEKKLEAANELCEEHEDAKRIEKTLTSIRNEIKTRLTMKTMLQDVDDLVERHRIAHKELNRDRKTSLISGIGKMRLKFPRTQMEIIDPDESSDSDAEPEDSK